MVGSSLRAIQKSMQTPRGRKKFIKPMFESNKWKVVRGDQVMIMKGKDRGQTGTVLQVIRDKARPRVTVEGRNLVMKSEMTNEGVTRFSVEAPVHYSNVQLLDPVTKKPVRIGYKFLEDGTKVRVTRGRNASGTVVPKSEVLKQRQVPRPPPGEKDTTAEEAARVSYTAADLPSLLRQATAAEAVRQYSTWVGRCAAQPPVRALPGSLPGGAWGGLRHRWRGFAAAAA